MERLLTVSLVMMMTSCAALVKDSRQQVSFRGGLENHVTKVITPDGTFEIQNGTGAYLMTRSKSDIPLKIMCPDGTTKSAIIDTSYDWLANVGGNFLSWGLIGLVVDSVSSKGYNIDDVSLSGQCNEPVREVASEAKIN